MDPEEIENRQFIVTLRGYARDEVDSFREEVAQEIKILRKQLTKATSELSHSNAELDRSRSQLDELNGQLVDVNAKLAAELARPEPEPAPRQEAPQPAPAEDRASAFKMVGQETERILLAAEQAAEQMHERAMKDSAEIMTDARMQVQRAMEEMAAARRAAEEDFAGIKESRSMVASQLEDIRRRLEETISRLRVPVELPGTRPASRYRQQPDAPEKASQPQPGRRPGEPQGQQLQQREMEAARELQARQNAHRAEAERREGELKAVQAEARKAQQAAEMQAAVSAAQEAERLKVERSRSAGETVRAKAQEAEARAKAEELARKRAEEAARAKADAAAKAKADAAAKAVAEEAARKRAGVAQAKADEAARIQAERAAVAAAETARAEAEKLALAEAERAAEVEAEQAAAAEKQQKRETEKPKVSGPDGGSSLDELLAEIRRKREEEERQADQMQLTPSATSNEQILRRREALGDLPAQTARRLKRLLQEDHNDLLDRLRTQRGKGQVNDNLATVDEQLDRFASGLNEALSRAFVEGRKAGGAAGDSDSSKVVTKLVNRQVLNPLRTEVSKAIESGIQAEDSAASLSERANDVFRVWKGVRTQLLGEGIAYAAYHQGLVDAWGSKAGAKKQWVLSEEENECPNDICRKNADAGLVALKSPFPSGHLSPPAHGGCTCTLESP